MKTIDVNQHSDNWLRWRTQGVTASDIPIILGLSSYKTPWQLWAEKIGRINVSDISNNPNVKRGLYLEDKARQLAEGRYGEILLPICGEYVHWRALRASFDGLDSKLRPYEFKAPCDSIWDELVNEGVNSPTYRMYESQVHAQCIVAGSKTGRLIFYNEDGRDLDFLVNLTSAKTDQILTAAKEFQQLIESKKPPEPDPERDWFIPDAGDQKFMWDGYAEAWRNQNLRIKSLKDELKTLENEQKLIQQEMITLMGPFMQADLGGVKVTRYMKKGCIDYKSFLEKTFPNKDYSDVLETFRKPSKEESRFSKSEDELVNLDVSEVKTSIKCAYF